jgi:hypothetical protein
MLAQWRIGLVAATLIGLTGFAGAATAANLIQNGDFSAPGAATAIWLQQGSTFIPGWTNYDNYSAYVPAGQTPDQNWQAEGGGTLTGSAGPGYGVNNGMVGPPGGGASVVIDGTYGFGPAPNYGYGYIEQTVAGLVAGETYTLSFMQAGSTEMGVNSPQMMNLQVTLGDQMIGASPSMSVPGEGFVDWNSYSTTFKWDGVGNVLQIAAAGTGDPAFVMLADVSLTGGGAPGTPEASTWVMIVAGFAGVGLMARARRKAAIAVA